MTTINISLPDKLKKKAEALVENGLFSSFSDLVRHSLRSTVEKNKYDLWAEQAKKELKEGKGVLLKTDKEIDEFMKSL